MEEKEKETGKPITGVTDGTLEIDQLLGVFSRKTIDRRNKTPSILRIHTIQRCYDFPHM